MLKGTEGLLTRCTCMHGHLQCITGSAHLPGAACGQQGDRGHKARHLVALFVQHVRAQAVPNAVYCIVYKIGGQVVLMELDVWVGLHGKKIHG